MFKLVQATLMIVVGAGVVGALAWFQEWMLPDLAGVVGASVLWLAIMVMWGWIVTTFLTSSEDPDGIREVLQRRRSEVYFLAIGMPGIWIGLVSDHPLLIALSSLVTWQALAWLIYLLPPDFPGSPQAGEVDLQALFYRTIALLSSVAIGMALGALSGL